MTKYGVDKSERGWEIIYSINGGPFCMGPEDESVVYQTRREAEAEIKRRVADDRAWNRTGLA